MYFRFNHSGERRRKYPVDCHHGNLEFHLYLFRLSILPVLIGTQKREVLMIFSPLWSFAWPKLYHRWYSKQHDLHLAPPPHNWDHLELSGIFILLLLLIIWARANRSDFTADIRRDHTRPLLLAPRLRNARFHPRPGLDHDLKIKIWWEKEAIANVRPKCWS